jgi:nucleoside-triphosphatase
VVFIDELGRMELASAAFREAVSALFDRDGSVMATVHVFGHPLSDALKRRPDVEVCEVTRDNRNALPAHLAGLVSAGLPQTGR